MCSNSSVCPAVAEKHLCRPCLGPFLKKYTENPLAADVDKLQRTSLSSSAVVPEAFKAFDKYPDLAAVAALRYPCIAEEAGPVRANAVYLDLLCDFWYSAGSSPESQVCYSYNVVRNLVSGYDSPVSACKTGLAGAAAALTPVVRPILDAVRAARDAVGGSGDLASAVRQLEEALNRPEYRFPGSLQQQLGELALSAVVIGVLLTNPAALASLASRLVRAGVKTVTVVVPKAYRAIAGVSDSLASLGSSVRSFIASLEARGAAAAVSVGAVAVAAAAAVTVTVIASLDYWKKQEAVSLSLAPALPYLLARGDISGLSVPNGLRHYADLYSRAAAAAVRDGLKGVREAASDAERRERAARLVAVAGMMEKYLEVVESVSHWAQSELPDVKTVQDDVLLAVRSGSRLLAEVEAYRIDLEMIAGQSRYVSSEPLSPVEPLASAVGGLLDGVLKALTSVGGLLLLPLVIGLLVYAVLPLLKTAAQEGGTEGEELRL